MRIFAALALSAMILVAGCNSNTTENLSQYEHKTAEQIYQTAKLLQKQGNAKMSADAFAALRAYHPASPLVKKSLTDSLKLHVLNKQYDEAKEIADKILDWYPASNIADEAYYFKGIAILGGHRTWMQTKLSVDPADLSKSRLLAAQSCFANVIKYFPHSRFVAEAKKHLQLITRYLAEHQLHIARYYLNHNNIAAAKLRINEAIAIDKSIKSKAMMVMKSGRGAAW